MDLTSDPRYSAVASNKLATSSPSSIGGAAIASSSSAFSVAGKSTGFGAAGNGQAVSSFASSGLSESQISNRRQNNSSSVGGGEGGGGTNIAPSSVSTGCLSFGFPLSLFSANNSRQKTSDNSIVRHLSCVSPLFYNFHSSIFIIYLFFWIYFQTQNERVIPLNQNNSSSIVESNVDVDAVGISSISSFSASNYTRNNSNQQQQQQQQQIQAGRGWPTNQREK